MGAVDEEQLLLRSVAISEVAKEIMVEENVDYATARQVVIYKLHNISLGIVYDKMLSRIYSKMFS